MEKDNVKKVIAIAWTVVSYVFMAIAFLCIILVIVLNKNDSSVFGFQMRTVISPSMESSEYTDVSDFKIKSLPVDTIVFIEEVPVDQALQDEWYRELKIGDVLTFVYRLHEGQQVVITHRIIDKIDNGNDGYIIYLEGDNKGHEDGIVTQVIDTEKQSDIDYYVIGKVIGESYPLGLLVKFLKSTWGMICIIILPVVVILILEVKKLVDLLTKDKLEAEKRRQQEQLEELEELRRKVALLEQQNNNSEG